MFFFFQAEDGIRDLVRSRGLGDVYKRQGGRQGETQAAGGEDDRGGRGVASKTLRGVDVDDALAEGAHDAPPTEIRAEGDGDGGRHLDPQRDADLGLSLIHISEPTRPY